MSQLRDFIPKKLLKNAIFIRDFRLQKTLTVCLLINKFGVVFEIHDKGILNSCQLKDFPEVETVECSLFFSYPGFVERKIFYMVKSLKKLYIIDRSKGFSLHDIYDEVNAVDVRDFDATGCPKVEISFENSGFGSIITDFNDTEKRTPSYVMENDDVEYEGLRECLNQSRQLTFEVKSQIHEKEQACADLFSKLCDKKRFAPIHLRSENQLEKMVLVQYGNVWKRVHNECLVIGIPILNATFQRSLTASDIKAHLLCKELSDLYYETCLYKCSEDYHSIIELESKFHQTENLPLSLDNSSTVPKFEQEWKGQKDNVLHGEQSGVVVLVVNLKTFNSLSTIYEFDCFIAYNLIDGTNVTHELQSPVNNIIIQSTDLLSVKHWVSFEKEALLDLLTVTATSKQTEFTLNYSNNTSKKDILEYLKTTLGFKLIHDESYMDKFLFENSFNNFQSSSNGFNTILYQNDGYLKHMLIRFKWLDSSKCFIKIYGTTDNQVLAFVKGLIETVDIDCRITFEKPADEQHLEALHLKESLLKELEHLLNGDRSNLHDFFEKQFKLELESDLISLNIRESGMTE